MAGPGLHENRLPDSFVFPTPQRFPIERADQLMAGMLYSVGGEWYLLWELRGMGGNGIVFLAAPVVSSCRMKLFDPRLLSWLPSERGVYRFLSKDVLEAFKALVARPPLHILKVLRIDRGDPNYEAAAARMDKEGRILSQFSHPSVPSFIAADSEPFPLLVVEFFPGMTVGHILASTGKTPFSTTPGRLAWRVITELTISLADVAQLFHRTGIVLRDLSPSQLILQARGGGRYSLCVVDLGMAREYGEDTTATGAAGLTATFGIESVGFTPAFAAPEVVYAPELVGPATDVFSLGRLIYAASEGMAALAHISGIAFKDEVRRPLRPCTHPSLELELRNMLNDLVDERIRHPDLKNPSGMCTPDPRRRPSLDDVVKVMRTIENYRIVAEAKRRSRT